MGLKLSKPQPPTAKRTREDWDDYSILPKRACPESVAIPEPQLNVADKDALQVRWCPPQDPSVRDAREVTTYQLEYRAALGFDWVFVPDCVARGPSEAEMKGEGVVWMVRRDENELNPGSLVSLRVRAVAGRLAGLVSPALETRFLDGPMPFYLREGEGCKKVELPSGCTVAEGRTRLEVAEASHLVLYLPSRHGPMTRADLEGRGLVLDERPHVALRDVPELQPWYCRAGGAQPGVLRRDLYVSEPVRRPGSRSLVLFLQAPSAIRAALPLGHEPPFPCWIEASEAADARTIKGLCCQRWPRAHLLPSDFTLSGDGGAEVGDDELAFEYRMQGTVFASLLLGVAPPPEFFVQILASDGATKDVRVSATTTLAQVARRAAISQQQILSLLRVRTPSHLRSESDTRRGHDGLRCALLYVW
jgi:hypothetical protein